MRRWIGGILTATSYDVIVVRYVLTVYLIPRSLWHRVIIDADDARRTGHGDQKPSLRLRVFLALRNFLTRRTGASVAHMWFPHPDDGPRLAARRKSLLPNFVRLPAAERPRFAAIPRRILVVGLMTYGSNLQGVRWFIEQVLSALLAQMPGVELHVVGRYHPHQWTWLQQQPVTLRGFVEDLATAYDQAALVIVPVFQGAGTQIKVIDGLAHGRPVVASAFAHAGFAGRFHSGRHLLVASGAEDWIRHCSWALRETQAAERMALCGQDAALAFGLPGMMAVVRDTLSELVVRN